MLLSKQQYKLKRLINFKQIKLEFEKNGSRIPKIGEIIGTDDKVLFEIYIDCCKWKMSCPKGRKDEI